MAEILRVRFTKVGKIRFTSHRDVARMWERALRRSGIPVARSQGFNPRPLVAFGLALPTGAESLAEYLDVALARAERPRTTSVTWADSGDRLSDFLPEGIDVAALAVLSGDTAGSLQQEVTSCSWELEVLSVTASELARRVERLLDAPSVSVQRERKGRTFDDDLRPSVLSLALFEPDGTSSSDGSACWLQRRIGHPPAGRAPDGNWSRRSAPMWCSPEPAERNSGSSRTALDGNR